MTDTMPRLQKLYREQVAAELQKELSLSNIHQIPQIEKITLNMGVGEAASDKKKLEDAVAALEKIAGQKVVKTLAKKSIAGFKIREGWPIGAKVTLRGRRMYQFLDRLIMVALPRVRDFRGVNTRLDGRGNYSMGIKEHIIFPEIDYDKVDAILGLDITITTSAKSDDQAFVLLKKMGIPFKERANKNAVQGA